MRDFEQLVFQDADGWYSVVTVAATKPGHICLEIEGPRGTREAALERYPLPKAATRVFAILSAQDAQRLAGNLNFVAWQATATLKDGE